MFPANPTVWQLLSFLLGMLLCQTCQVGAAFSLRGDRSSGRPLYCETCKGPVHSWKTFPVSFHCGRINTRGPTGLEFHPEDIATMAKFPLVTLEKWQASSAFSTTSDSPVFYWEEDAWIAAARQIKQASPNTSVAAWMDTMLIYTGWNWPEPPKGQQPAAAVNHTLNPDANEHCATGHFRAAEFLETDGKEDYLLYNTSGLPALEPWSHCHIYDHSKPQVRQYWMEICLNLTSTGVIDGCGADFSSLEPNRWASHTSEYVAKQLHLDDDTASAWIQGHRQLMKDTTEALGDGILIGKDAPELGDHVNAVLHEGCAASNSTINLLQSLSQKAKDFGQRLVYQCHGRADIDPMAAFLCGAGKDHYFTTGGWTDDSIGFPSHWSHHFERPLGEPLTDGIYNHETTVWTRIFASGTVVRFNATSNKGSIEWNDELEGRYSVARQ